MALKFHCRIKPQNIKLSFRNISKEKIIMKQGLKDLHSQNVLLTHSGLFLLCFALLWVKSVIENQHLLMVNSCNDSYLL